MAEQLDPGVWLDRYGDVLFRYAIARVQDKTVAEDLVQDTLLAAIGAIDTFKGGSTEQTWLVGILRHKVLDYFRKASRESQWQQDWGESTEWDRDFDDQGGWAGSINPWPTPEKALEHDEFWNVLRGCVTSLPENLRAAFALRELDGLGSEELMATLDISTKNNLWVMLSRARKQVRQCLQNKWFAKG